MINENQIRVTVKALFLLSFILGLIGLSLLFIIGKNSLLIYGFSFLFLGIFLEYFYDLLIKYKTIYKKNGFKEFFKEILVNFIFVMAIVSIILILSFGVFAQTPMSAINENENNYEIKCFHEGNLVTLYDKDNTKIYEEKCYNNYEQFGKELFNNVKKIEIKNPSNVTDRYIRYTETLDESNKKDYEVKKEQFHNKYCFTVKTKVYSNIKIQNEEFTQKKNAYKCIKKTKIDKVVEIRLDDKLIKTYQVKKKDNGINIELEKKGQINKDYKDKVKITFTKKTNNMKRINVIDTNMECPKDDFRLGKKFSMSCNITKLIDNKDLIYYIQVRDNNKNTFYKEEEFKLSIRKDNTPFIWEYKWVLLVLIVSVIMAVRKYNNSVNEKNKTVVEKIDEDEDEEK